MFTKFKNSFFFFLKINLVYISCIIDYTNFNTDAVTKKIQNKDDTEKF